jgi:multiple sugar transport system permease protein
MKPAFIQRSALAIAFSAVVGIILIVFLFPVYWIFATSLKTQAQTWAIPPLLTFTPTLDNYVTVFTRRAFLPSLFNTILISTFGAAFTTFFGSLAAYAFTRFRFRGSSVLSTGILVTRMFPAVILALPVYLMARDLQILDTILVVVAADVTVALPFVIWLMIGFFRQVSRELDDAALIDGCSWFGAYWRIVLPAVAPGLVATGILSFIYHWNEFFFALVLTRLQAKPASVWVTEFVTFQGIDWGAITAGAALLALPTLAFALVAQRWLVRGLTAGAVKG